MSFLRRIVAMLRVGRFEPDLDAEIRHHLELEYEANLRRGLSVGDARAEAQRQFGSVALTKDECRDAWAVRTLDALRQDVRLALRMARRAPSFTLAIVATLALGIGSIAAIFSVIDAVLLERLPYRDAGRVVMVWEENAQRPGRLNVVAPANFLEWRDRATAFEALAAFFDSTPSLSGTGDPEEVAAQTVTPEFFDALGVAPIRGRVFTAADPGEARDAHATVALISEPLWERRFARDPQIVGRTIDLSARPVTVIGIMPADARLLVRRSTFVGELPDVWLPLAFTAADREPRGRYLTVIGRLHAGETIEHARAQMNTIAASLEQRFPKFDTQWRVRLTPLHAELSGDLRPTLLALAGAVAFVLLIACANVANLLLSHGAARSREIAVRAALGAGRWRVVRQLLTEIAVLAVFGGAAGLLIAWGLLHLLVALSPVDLSIAGAGVQINRTVLTFTAVVSIATAILCGIAPAIDRARADLHAGLASGARQTAGPGARRLRRLFVVGEVALGLVLLVGAGLMLRSVAALRGVNPGFDASHVLTARVSLPTARYPDAAARLRFFTDLADRLRTLPGVQSAGIVSFLPLAELGAATDFSIEGAPPPGPGQEPVVDVRVCDNGYFDAMRIPVIAGRLFTPREMRENSDVVVINEALARQYFPAGDAIGHRLAIDMGPVGADQNPTTIVGIVGDVMMSNLATQARATAYWPLAQLPMSGLRLTVRTAGEPLAAASAVERLVHELDRNQPVSDVRTMDQWMAKSIAQTRFSAALLATFAGLALLLAAIGIYAVMAYSVVQRTSELGIRLALGASPRDIVSLVVGQGIALTAAGTALGLLLALALAGTIRSLLFGTSRADPVTFGAAAAALAAVGVVASYLPARRASRIEPTVALRSE